MKTPSKYLAFATCLTVVFAYGARPPCFGQSTIYWDRSMFEAAISDLAGTRADMDFQPPFPPGGIDQGVWIRYSMPLTISGITFRSTAPLLIRTQGAGNYFLNKGSCGEGFRFVGVFAGGRNLIRDLQSGQTSLVAGVQMATMQSPHPRGVSQPLLSVDDVCELGENFPNPSSRFGPLNRSRRREEAEGLANPLSPPRYLGG
jgi:hypothetical protein